MIYKFINPYCDIINLITEGLQRFSMSSNTVFKFILAFSFVFLSSAQSRDSLVLDLKRFFSPTKALLYKDADAAIATLNDAHKEFLNLGDTLKSIEALIQVADIYGHRADYASSYDAFWKSLSLADQLKNDSLNVHISMRLGRFYSFYKRENESLQYLQNSLDIQKRRVAKGEALTPELVPNYYAFLSTYRELNRPLLAEKYLDSCMQYYQEFPEQVPMPQLQFEEAVILSQRNKNQKALEIMKKTESWFQEYRPSYLVLVYSYWGDIYRNLGDLQSGGRYYQKALDLSREFKAHIDFTPLIYERIAALYFEKGDYRRAFENQKMAKELDADFFDSRSTKNRTLLEIKDEFRLEKQRQESLIQQQRLAQLEQEEEILLLQRLLLLVAIISLLLIAFVYFFNLRNKHKIEKKLIAKSKELEIQKANDLLRLKNKELATSALQLVEKDEFLKELKNKLRSGGEQLKVSEINKVLQSISISNTNNWEQFRLRFTAVNEEFYGKLTEKYPKLNQSDHKICALIKLNFSSKDMARLLGISVESVHTTRYRLRKKLELSRSENLEDFIANL